MRQIAVPFLIAALLGSAVAPAVASDEAAAAWHAAQRANAAQQALSDRYTAIWATLDATQKSRFSAQERAWLNDGRQQELRACVAHVGRSGEAVVRSCEAEVIERHLGRLVAPQRVASSG